MSKPIDQARELFEQMGNIADDEKCIELLAAALIQQPASVAVPEPDFYWIDSDEGSWNSPEEWAQDYYDYNGEKPESVSFSCAIELKAREYDSFEFDADGNCISCRLVNDEAATHPVSGEQKQAYPVIRQVRPHSHKCANVQINATSDTACDCGAVVSGVAVDVAPAALDVSGLVEALKKIADRAEVFVEAENGMQHESVEMMEEIAKRAIDAHRAQHGEQPS